MLEIDLDEIAAEAARPVKAHRHNPGVAEVRDVIDRFFDVLVSKGYEEQGQIIGRHLDLAASRHLRGRAGALQRPGAAYEGGLDEGGGVGG